MSDEQQDLNLEDVGAGAEGVAGPRRGGLLSGMLLIILKWAAIAVAFIILAVTTVIITMNIRDKGRSSQNLAAVSPAYESKSEPYAYYDSIEEIRGQTADETPAIFLIKLSLGYDQKAKDVNAEIGQRAREIQDLVLKIISMKTAAELSPAHYDEIQAEIKSKINMLMKSGKIKSVAFRGFTVSK